MIVLSFYIFPNNEHAFDKMDAPLPYLFIYLFQTSLLEVFAAETTSMFNRFMLVLKALLGNMCTSWQT